MGAGAVEGGGLVQTRPTPATAGRGWETSGLRWVPPLDQSLLEASGRHRAREVGCTIETGVGPEQEGGKQNRSTDTAEALATLPRPGSKGHFASR